MTKKLLPFLLLPLFACGRYALVQAPENRPRPVGVEGHSLFATNAVGDKIVEWYKTPEETAFILARFAAGQQTRANELEAQVEKLKKEKVDAASKLAEAPKTEAPAPVK